MGEAAEHLSVSRNFGHEMPIEELALADQSITEGITRKITEEERASYNEEIAQMSVKIAKEEAEKKDVMAQYTKSLKFKKSELADVLDIVESGEREELVPVAVFFDWDGLKVWKYKPDGKFLSVRPMTNKERQRKLA